MLPLPPRQAMVSGSRSARASSAERPSTSPPPSMSCCKCCRFDAGRVVTVDTLLRRVSAKRENADANLVRIFVRNLRRKLGDSAATPPTCSTSAA